MYDLEYRRALDCYIKSHQLLFFFSFEGKLQTPNSSHTLITTNHDLGKDLHKEEVKEEGNQVWINTSFA
jgi:hypothetical protein